ncbi:hypothetical protein [Kistimonas scapharcae]|uniref:hypothetical protein n=1 Tax=Kistimonas scapharcae TaxID=1036133 RepID=UPI0031E61AE0
MDNIKPALLASGTYSIPQSQEAEVGQREYCKKEAVELTKGIRGEVRSIDSKKIKDRIIQFLQRMLPDKKELGGRKITVEINQDIQALKQNLITTVAQPA